MLIFQLLEVFFAFVLEHELDSKPKLLIPIRASDFHIALDEEDYIFFLAKNKKTADYSEGAVFLHNDDHVGYKIFISGIPVCVTAIDTVEPCNGVQAQTSWVLNKTGFGYSICMKKETLFKLGTPSPKCISIQNFQKAHGTHLPAPWILMKSENKNDENQIFRILDIP